MIEFELDVFKYLAEKIFTLDSPTGYTKNAIDFIKQYVEELGYASRLSNKGTLAIEIDGEDNNKVVASSAHVDTLGLMVRSIKSDGKLALTKLGGPISATLDGEYCRILTRTGQIYTGTIVSTSAASHVYKDAESKPRDIDNLEVRIDEKVSKAEDVNDLHINNGDFVFIDPKFSLTDSGFLKSRFIDDKASVVILLMLLKYVKEHHLKFKFHTILYFVVYEEVGHGASCIDERICEFVTLDMGCVGADLAGNEYAVSICAKDSNGPYDYELTNLMIDLAKNAKLDYTVDIFPFYGSDVGAAIKAGHDFKGALIGTGVHASHGMERTHLKGIEATLKLIYCYLIK